MFITVNCEPNAFFIIKAKCESKIDFKMKANCDIKANCDLLGNLGKLECDLCNSIAAGQIINNWG